MKKIFIGISILVNFIFGFISMYAFLWWAIALYSVNCLVKGCSDMAGEEWSGIILGLIIAVSISVVLVPLMIYTNLNFIRVTGVRKKYYLLYNLPVLILGFIVGYYLRTHQIGPF